MLVVEPSVVCGSADHMGPLILAVILLVVFVVGLPLFMVGLYIKYVAMSKC